MELFYINLSLAGLQLSAWIQILMLFQSGHIHLPWASLVLPSWLVMNQMLGEQAMTMILTQSQDLNCLLVSGDGSLDCHQCMILTKLASCLGLGSLSTRINIAAAKWTNMAWPIRLLILYIHRGTLFTSRFTACSYVRPLFLSVKGNI